MTLWRKFLALGSSGKGTPAKEGAENSPAPTPKARRGLQGEDAAAKYLQGQGFAILHRNWRHGRLELDMVCTEGHTIVFVEVKTRDAHGMTSPADALTPRKKSALIRAARAWLAANKAWEKPCRFDLVGVLCDGVNLSVEHYRHAFDLSQPVGGGDTSWQPW